MNKEFYEVIKQFDIEIQEMFNSVCNIIVKVSNRNLKMKLWAHIPSFYIDKRFIRIIPFKDHINIEAMAIVNHYNELYGYKISSKGMLQIYKGQQIPKEQLIKIVNESFYK